MPWPSVWSRRAAISFAIGKANRSSPSLFNTSVICSTVACISHSCADRPTVGSMRMSSGPSPVKLKPRRGSSTCGDEMPRSSSSPSICVSPCASSTSSSDEKRACTISNRASPLSCFHARAAATASGSLSNANRRPFGPRACRMCRLCPPRPNVPSTYTPSGRMARAATASCSSTGKCAPDDKPSRSMSAPPSIVQRPGMSPKSSGKPAAACLSR